MAESLAMTPALIAGTIYIVAYSANFMIPDPITSAKKHQLRGWLTRSGLTSAIISSLRGQRKVCPEKRQWQNRP